MITLLPISKNIQNTLFQKMAMLSAGGNRTVSINEDGKWVPSNQIINKELTKDGKLVQNFMHTRTVWMRMTSFTPRAGTKNTAVIIMGGELGGDIARAGTDTEFSVAKRSKLSEKISVSPSSARTSPQNQQL